MIKENLMNGIEWIKDGEAILSVVIRSFAAPEKTSFITPDSFTQQAGFIVYPAGGEIVNHTHKMIARQLTGTPETLFIRKGKLKVRFYNSVRELKGETVVEAGDILMLVSGGHGFSIIEDAILFEIKQGPYTGLVEKERFE
jgi:hypothetical protein